MLYQADFSVRNEWMNEFVLDLLKWHAMQWHFYPKWTLGFLQSAFLLKTVNKLLAQEKRINSILSFYIKNRSTGIYLFPVNIKAISFNLLPKVTFIAQRLILQPHFTAAWNLTTNHWSLSPVLIIWLDVFNEYKGFKGGETVLILLF